jgi:hypothetical protein
MITIKDLLWLKSSIGGLLDEVENKEGKTSNLHYALTKAWEEADTRLSKLVKEDQQ